jgi:hypothetical protein
MLRACCVYICKYVHAGAYVHIEFREHVCICACVCVCVCVCVLASSHLLRDDVNRSDDDACGALGPVAHDAAQSAPEDARVVVYLLHIHTYTHTHIRTFGY